MSDKQIQPLTTKNFDYIHFDFPFFIASVYLYGKKRWLTPIWPAQPEPYNIPMGTSFHYHAHYELIYILEGTFTQHLENTVYCLNAGDCTLLNRQIRHYEGDETECSCIYINLSSEFLYSLFHSTTAGTNLTQHDSKHVVRLCDENIADLEQRVSLDFRRTLHGKIQSDSLLPDSPKNIISEIIAELSQKKWGYLFSLQSLLLKLFASLENPDYYHVTRIYTHSSTDTILFSGIQHYVRERNGRISREELSSLLHYNSDYLARIVKQQTGMSFLQYCRTFWLEKAKELLCDTDMSIVDIIHFLEFENKSNFYNFFCSAMGMTPSEYRKQCRKKSDSITFQNK